MSSVRPAAVSGTFYPAVRAKLHQMVIDLLNEVQVEPVAVKALIAPHAGYIYSGPVAAGGYARLTSQTDSIKRVVLLGPSHRVAFAGIAAPKSTVFETPLGQVSVDQKAIDSLLDLPWVRRSDHPHLQEHSLEVQLPFLQTVLNNFALVPLVVGQAEAAQVAEVIDRLWGGDETLIVVSSDLSHYLDYDSACKIDMKTTRAIEDLRAEDIDFDQACGRLPVQGLLQIIKKRGLRCITVDLRNSGDTAGPRDHVVGYGAYVFN
ncbi:MAG: AmmeMemoRadiSam system protein B [Pseudomonadota bacterium]